MPAIRPRSQPTYEGLKPGYLQALPIVRPRSQPTYEGLKQFPVQGSQVGQKRFPAYLRGIETRNPLRPGAFALPLVPSLPTRD